MVIAVRSWLRLAIGAAVAAAAAALAAAPPPPPSAQLVVKRTRTESSADGKTSHSDYYSGYSSKDVSRSISLEITVRNTGVSTNAFNLEWYFIAENVSGGGRYICDEGRQTLTLKKAESQAVSATSKPVSAQVQKYSSEGYNSKSQQGSKMEGYVVRVLADGKILAREASSRPLLDYATDAKIAALRKAAPQPASAGQGGGLAPVQAPVQGQGGQPAGAAAQPPAGAPTIKPGGAGR